MKLNLIKKKLKNNMTDIKYYTVIFILFLLIIKIITI